MKMGMYIYIYIDRYLAIGIAYYSRKRIWDADIYIYINIYIYYDLSERIVGCMIVMIVSI